MPVMAALFLARRVSAREPLLVRLIKRPYEPLLRWAMAHPVVMIGGSVAVSVLSLIAASTLGLEFVPKLDEGDIAIQAVRLPSVSLESSLEMTKAMEKTLLSSPEVQTVVSKTGRPEIANDPMGVHQTDLLVRLRSDHGGGGSARDKAALIEEMHAALERDVPSNSYSFTQLIELRVQELVAGVRSDVGLSLYGDDLSMLQVEGDKIVRALNQVRGAADVQAQQVAGLPYVRVIIRRESIARYGINAAAVLDAVSIVGGRVVGEVFEGQRRFPLQVRIASGWRQDVEAIRELKIDDPQGRQIPLSQLADIVVEEGPSEISRDAIRRRLLIQCNVRGRDLAGFVADAKATVDREVKLPPGYNLEWGGQFESLERASQRLMIAVPVALLLIFSLLYMTFGTVRLTLLIFLNVPIAATGGIFALWLRGMPLSISAGVGLIALFGIAVMNGVVLVEHIRHLRREGDDQPRAVFLGSLDRLQPVLMTATTDTLGFVPMAISSSAGAEVQRPLSTVVIGGLVTSTILTLLVLPAIYRWFEPRDDQPESQPGPS